MAPSFLDDLRAIRDNVLEVSSKDIPVPGSAGRVVLRVQPPAGQDARDRLAGVVASYRTTQELTPRQELQLLVDSCDEILRQNPETGELEQPEGDGPLRFDASDERWGTDVETAHDCVSKLFNLDKQPLAISGIADSLVDWLVGLDAEIRARVEGNSPAAKVAASSPQPPA